MNRPRTASWASSASWASRAARDRDGRSSLTRTVLALTLAAAGCSTGTGRLATTATIPVGAPYGTTHPLAGQLWSPAAATLVSDAQLTMMLADARIVLLGEQHDNPDHHRLQAFVLERMGEIGRRPVMVFEMIDRDRQQAVDACRAARRCRAADLAAAAEWNERGWPDWQLYAPVLSQVTDQELLVVAGGLGREQIRAVVQSGNDALDPDLRERLDVDAKLSLKTREAMVEEIRVSHCGHPPQQLINGMVTAQRLKDAYMASQLAATQTSGTTVLIAGNGHTRNDWGVPAHLQRMVPSAARLSIAFLEVRDELTDPSDYAQLFGASALPFDLVWFTARVDETDPCEQFKEQLERMKIP